MRYRGHERRPFKVVRSPLDETGLPAYPPGAKFSQVDVYNSLKLRGFPSGTVFLYQGAMLKVDRSRLMRLDGTQFILRQKPAHD
jgi:hypothetical protein